MTTRLDGVVCGDGTTYSVDSRHVAGKQLYDYFANTKKDTPFFTTCIFYEGTLDVVSPFKPAQRNGNYKYTPMISQVICWFEFNHEPILF